MCHSEELRDEESVFCSLVHKRRRTDIEDKADPSPAAQDDRIVAIMKLKKMTSSVSDSKVEEKRE